MGQTGRWSPSNIRWSQPQELLSQNILLYLIILNFQRKETSKYRKIFWEVKSLNVLKESPLTLLLLPFPTDGSLFLGCLFSVLILLIFFFWCLFIYYWWLVRVTLVVAWCFFCLKILGGGGDLRIIFFLKNACTLSGGENVRWWGHPNPLHNNLVH